MASPPPSCVLDTPIDKECPPSTCTCHLQQVKDERLTEGNLLELNCLGLLEAVKLIIDPFAVNDYITDIIFPVGGKSGLRGESYICDDGAGLLCAPEEMNCKVDERHSSCAEC